VWGSCRRAGPVDVSRPVEDGLLTRRARVVVGRHPSALAIHGKRLFVACATTDEIVVVDTATNKAIETLSDAAPGGPREGSTPNALAVSHDRLFVAEADNNAVAVFDAKTYAMLGRVPVEWYPSALVAAGSDIVVVNAKGRDGDPALQFFGADAAPNHRGLAARFGLFDRFFVNAEVSAHGHNWSTAAYTSDYVEKVVPMQYGRRGRSYDYEGNNRDAMID